MKKCEYCNSIFVCWNWFHQSKEKLIELNHRYFDSDEWGHECWKCNGVQITDIKVTNGIPYWLLKFIFRYFKKIKDPWLWGEL